MNLKTAMNMQRSISRFHGGLREALADNYIWGNYNVGDEIYNKACEFMVDVERTIKKWIPIYKEGSLINQHSYNTFSIDLLEGRIKLPYGFNRLGVSVAFFMKENMPEVYEPLRERLEFISRVGNYGSKAERECTNYTRLVYACPYMEKFIDKTETIHKVSKKHIDGWLFNRDEEFLNRIENEINVLMLTRKFTASIPGNFQLVNMSYEKGETR